MSNHSIKVDNLGESITYDRPPIIEATIGISTISAGMDVNVLDYFKKTLEEDYPEYQIMGQTNVHPLEKNLNLSSENIGLKLTSANKRHVLQIMNNYFAFSMLGNYEGWSFFSQRALKLWNDYINKLNPEKVSRIDVRYINRIDIPHLRFEIEDYFNVYPKVLADCDIFGFFMQTQIKQEKGFATINQTITAPKQPGYTSIILDLDIFEVGEFKLDNSHFWKKIEELRRRKNALFESIITDKTRRLFI